jgi:hypothetical protein
MDCGGPFWVGQMEHRSWVLRTSTTGAVAPSGTIGTPRLIGTRGNIPRVGPPAEQPQTVSAQEFGQTVGILTTVTRKTVKAGEG